jgi:hypothetical protein
MGTVTSNQSALTRKHMSIEENPLNNKKKIKTEEKTFLLLFFISSPYFSSGSKIDAQVVPSLTHFWIFFYMLLNLS